jgi:hypothetical protein
MDDERSVRVSNAIFTPSPRYQVSPDNRNKRSCQHLHYFSQVKLEGASQAGFRTIFIGGIRDPTLIAGIDDFLLKVQQIQIATSLSSTFTARMLSWATLTQSKALLTRSE